MHEFAENPEVEYGLTTMCVGLGQGGSVIWENLQNKENKATF
jgi:acetyl-CoA acyltransferase